jgi:hypothetical protein
MEFSDDSRAVDREARIQALAERSSYVENVLRHAFLAELSFLVWANDPFDSLKVSNAEVDDCGYDVVLARGNIVRHVQLKQAHDEKIPKQFSVRVSFATLPGSCVVVISHALADLRPTSYGFYGGGPKDEMPYIDVRRITKSPGRRNANGERVLRLRYRDVPFSRFKPGLTGACQDSCRLFMQPTAVYSRLPRATL